MWKCPNCETMNEGVVCVICGETVPKSYLKKIEKAAKKEAKKAKKLNAAQSGLKISNYKDTGANDASQKPKSGKKKWIIITAIICLVAIIGTLGAVWSLGKNDEGKKEQAIKLKDESIVKVFTSYNDIYGIRKDGKIVAVGDNNHGELNVYGWEKICDVHPTGMSTIALTTDGRVKATGWGYVRFDELELWTDIIQIDAGIPIVGLKSDGTVCYTLLGAEWSTDCDYSGLYNWTDIKQVSVGYDHVVGLKSDGTVVAVGMNDNGECDVEGWKDIVEISAGSGYTVGLKSDGTVVATGWDDNDQYDVEDWKDIIAISAVNGNHHIVGLKSDGTVVATGENYFGECDVEDWKDVVAISTGRYRTAGLKSDGTVIATGINYYGQCNVSDWVDIIAISVDESYTVGVKSDGTVVAVGLNDNGQCDVSHWGK